MATYNNKLFKKYGIKEKFQSYSILSWFDHFLQNLSGINSYLSIMEYLILTFVFCSLWQKKKNAHV